MNELTTLAGIEYRIALHMQGAYQNLMEVGRALCEAKDGGLVPHGQWEDWVRRNTGMSERSAQRLMQAAREVQPGSALAKLPVSKIQAILALPEEHREAVAEKAAEENQSLRQLQDEIKRLKIALGNSCDRERVAIAASERASNSARTARANTDKALEMYNAAIQERDAARKALEEAHAEPATGISAEAQAKIDELTAQVQDAERMAEYQAEQRQQAQQELMNLKSQAARGDAAPGEDLTVEAVGLAVRTFIGAVGFLRFSPQITALRADDRGQVLAYARMIAEWAEKVEAALASVDDAIVIAEVTEP